MNDPNKKKKIIGGVLPHDTFTLKSNIFPEESVDIESLINELIAQRRYFPFNAQGKQWLWCPTMAKHQNIQHPATIRNYPDPPKELVEKYNAHIPLNEPSMSPHIPLTQSRVELSRVELSRVESKAEPSPALTAALDKVYNKGKGINIFALMSKLKKQTNQPKDWQFPEEVLLEVCKTYEQDKAKIKHPWPWFVKVIKDETALWHAQQQINANKKDREFAQSLKDILGMK